MAEESMASNGQQVSLDVTDSKGRSSVGLINRGFFDIDNTPVSESELRAWFISAAAIYPITFGGLSFFIPLIVQALSAGSGFVHVDHTIPCNTTSSYTCDIYFGGAWLDVTAFYFYNVAIATAIQMVIFITCGSIADHRDWRKSIYLWSSLLGGTCCLLFPVLIRNDHYIYAWILTIIITVCIGICWMLVYAYLPVIARNHPDFLAKVDTAEATKDTVLRELDSITNSISSRQFVWMYVAALLGMAAMIVLALVYSPSQPLPETYALQIGIALFGVIWLGGALIVRKYLRARPGPLFPIDANIFTFSTKNVLRTIKKANQMKQLFTFLIGWFMFSDSFQTLSSVAVLWAQSQLGFTTKDSLILAVEVPLAAGIGVIMWRKLQEYTKITSKTLLVIQSGLYTIVPLWGVLGFIPGIPVGYRTKLEIFVFSAYHGILLGGSQSTCRSLYAQLIPPGSEAEFFSLYEITDKGSAWLGPLVVAAINNSGANKLYSMVFLAAQFGLGFIAFSLVDVKQGN
ncbi:autophagy-related protein 22-like protein [Obelidium mucronatum]|nr:autophagy-related protein 22-like protein [Obelidium mucronatum]